MRYLTILAIVVLAACSGDSETTKDSGSKDDTSTNNTNTNNTTNNTNNTTNNTNNTTNNTNNTTNNTKPDGGTDMVVMEDTGTDVVIEKDTGPVGTLTCNEAYLCAKKCTDINCINDCTGQTCPAGATTITDLTTCVWSNCINDCVTSFDHACETCVTTHCATEVTACEASTC